MKTIRQKIVQTLKSFLAVSTLATVMFANADDTEVFYSVNVANNLLFVLDVSGSMKKQIISTETITTTGTTTTSGGGTSGEFDFSDNDYNDDATQKWSSVATGGYQWHDSGDLDLETDIVVGTRFTMENSNKIPQGATITSAYIQFESDDNDSAPTSIDIAVENTGYAYNYSSSNPKILSRPYVGSVSWNPPAWSNNEDSTDTRTPDLTSLVQQVVNRSDWGSGHSKNRIAFKFVTSSGERDAHSRDDGSSTKATLHIEYTHGSSSKSSYGYIDDDDDDAEQSYTYSNDQNHGENELVFNDTQVVATRFRLKDDSPDALIPQGAIIVEAYIKFTSAGSYSDNTSIDISIEDTGNAQNYDSGNPKIRARNYHGQLLWQPTAWLNDGDQLEPQQTVDISDLLQYVVNRSDWDNSLAFMFNTTAGERIAYARDNGLSQAPVLHVEYQDIGGGSTGTTTTTTGTTTTITRIDSRLKFMQEALREVLATAPNFNVGLMKYSGIDRDLDRATGADNKRHHYVGGVLYPVSPIYGKATDAIGGYNQHNLPDPNATITTRDYIPDVVDNWVATGGTPIVDALYEAALYFRGEQMHYGKNKNNNGLNQKVSPGAHRSTFVGGAEINPLVGAVGRDRIADANYISPIKSDCQSNYIVLMSDGKPTYYYSDQSGSDNEGPFARAMKGTNASALASAIPSCNVGNGEAGNAGTNLTAGTCGREITQYLANNDQSSTVDGDQPVKTFTIGFGHDLADGARDYLESLVTVDDDPATPEREGYYDAGDKTKLKEAFQEIFTAVAEPSGTLASPGYSVNVKSGLEHEDDIYIPVFNRKNSSRWAGNLKKFRIVDVNGKRNIQSVTGNNAVDELGGFEDDALDFWSTSPATAPDGVDVEKGGAAALLNPETRKLFSDLACSGTSACALNTSNNLLTASNTESSGQITNEVLGIDGLGLTSTEADAKRKILINFIRGWEGGNYDASATPKGIERKHMGDMLHSEPLVITYQQEGSTGGKKQFIFAGTNEGYLHVFDTETGAEKFAFMPKELLKNIEPQYVNAGTARDHKYGIDGVLTYWHDDENGDGNVDVTKDKVYLFFGLRRGGRSYYALDITKINQPDPEVTLLWKKSSTDTGMSLLGQSWSAPYLAKVGLSDGSNKEVVIISGGYDEVDDRDKPGQHTVLDDPTASVTTTMGHNIYILDALNGDLIWSLRESMGDTQLSNSIPGGVRILDVNRNGMIDRMYFADTGGNVWRLDLSEKLSTTGDSESKLTKLADLDDTGVNARKFYNEPDVSAMSPNGKTIFAVSVGSGFRAHPKDKTIHDKFFVLKDESPYYPLEDNFTPIDISKLASVTISKTTGVLSQNDFGSTTKDKGWYLTLPEDGEKVLATAVTFDGVITFTSLVPEVLTSGAGIDPCAAPVTQGRLYALNILTGEAALDLDFSNEPNPEDRITDADAFATVAKGEIPGKPQLIFNAIRKQDELDGNGKLIKSTCSHPVDLRIGKKRSQATGYDACRLESIYWNDPDND